MRLDRGRRENLEADRQALIFGNLVPMAMVIQTRKHGTPEFYKSIQRPVAAGDGARLSADDLWGAIE